MCINYEHTCTKNKDNDNDPYTSYVCTMYMKQVSIMYITVHAIAFNLALASIEPLRTNKLCYNLPISVSSFLKSFSFALLKSESS